MNSAQRKRQGSQDSKKQNQEWKIFNFVKYEIFLNFFSFDLNQQQRLTIFSGQPYPGQQDNYKVSSTIKKQQNSLSDTFYKKLTRLFFSLFYKLTGEPKNKNTQHQLISLVLYSSSTTLYHLSYLPVCFHWTVIYSYHFQISGILMVTLNIAFFRWSRLLHQGAQKDDFSRIQQVKSARLDTGVYQTSYLAEWKKKSSQFCQMRSSLIERFQNFLDINLNPKYYLTFYNQINRRLERMANKRIWTAQEDNFLRQQAGVAQNKNWVKISSKLNEIFGGESRSPKQCRQRYINHASTSKENPFSNQWSQDNTKTLFQLYEIYGPRWTTIAHTMTNKSENIVKNKFYCSLRKFTRKLNKFLKSGQNKYKKQIKYQSIIRIMDAHDSYSELPEHFKTWSCEIRKKVLQLTQVTISDGQIEDEILDWVTENVNKFNLQTRSYKPKKPHAEEAEKNVATISSKSESCRNSSETDEQIFPNNTKPTRGKSDNGKMEEGKKQNNEIIYAERTCEQNSKFGEMLRQENLSQQELIKDFGTAAEFQPDRKNNCEKDLYYEMFSQEFPRFQIDEFLL